MTLRSRLLAVCFIVAAAAALPEAIIAETLSPAQQQMLVEQLGDDSFEIRQQADTQLTKLGLGAKQALHDGMRHGDLEIRTRCERIWSRVQAVDFENKLKAFVAGDDSQGLPGWDLFRVRIGDDREARNLFIEMQRSEPRLLKAIESSPKAAGELLPLLCRDYQQTLSRPIPGKRPALTMGCVATLLFAASDERVPLDMQTAAMLYNFVNQAEFQTGLNNDRSYSRKLLGGWIARPNSTQISYQCVILAMRYDLPEGLTAALRMLHDGTHASQKAYAIVAIAKLGKESHVAELEKLLSDKTACATFNINKDKVTTQVRDVALASMVHLSGQDLGDYGFDRVKKNPQLLFYPYSLGFVDDQKRDDAFKKWDQWRSARGKARIQKGTTTSAG